MSAKVSLPEGASLKQVAQVLLDAWEAGSHQWTGSPLHLRDGAKETPQPPVPRDAPELFRILAKRQVPYLLVGGVAMLTYVRGRNMLDVDLLMSVASMRAITEFDVVNQQDCFVRARFRSVQVEVLLTTNPLFKIVEERFATRHRFSELEVPTATVEGLLVLKLYALPSLYRQMDMDRVALYENDITMLLARHDAATAPLLAMVEPHVEPADVKKLRTILGECSARAARMKERLTQGD
jgi:hypothetical protein